MCWIQTGESARVSPMNAVPVKLRFSTRFISALWQARARWFEYPPAVTNRSQSPRAIDQNLIESVAQNLVSLFFRTLANRLDTQFMTPQ